MSPPSHQKMDITQHDAPKKQRVKESKYGTSTTTTYQRIKESKCDVLSTMTC